MKSFFDQLAKKEAYKVVGLMSGTSEDGVDLCYAKFSKLNKNWTFEIIICETVPYAKEELELLHWAFLSEGRNLSKFDREYGQILAKKLEKFMLFNAIEADFISSHGHTIFHQPEKGITVQIGDGQIIANALQIPVVNNFRIRDVELGGQGAPLVPIGDQLLFHEFDACLNLGGFSNVSYFKKERLAFDVSPANLPLNTITKERLNMAFDRNGEWARYGETNELLLAQLNALAYYQKPAPKSLGVEWLNAEFYPVLKQFDFLKPEDLLSTMVEHIADQIACELNKIGAQNCLISGGGVKNRYLIDRIKEKTKTVIVIPPENIVDFKEALIFGFLGVLRIRNEVNTLKSVTGASQDSVGGELFLPH